jgi:hypothetical protein
MAKTVRVLLHAGLGNQMFMYAAGRALALRTGGRLVLELRRFIYEHVYHRIFLLDRFPVEAEIDEGTSLSRRLGRQVEARAMHYRPLRSLWGLRLEQSPEMYEPDLVEAPPRRSVVLDGFWQSERYFADHAAVIRQDLAPPRPTVPEIQADLRRVESSSHPVAVCIRTYQEVSGHAVDLPGITAAYRAVLQRHAATRPGASYFLMTDLPDGFADPACLGVPFTLIGRSISNEAAPENLHVLTRCQEYVLGFSTFHWWGAWLSVATRPAVTYLRFPSDTRADFVPSTWTVVTAPP